eukprot:328528-Pleurochrysis_carterae.AAC.1
MAAEGAPAASPPPPPERRLTRSSPTSGGEAEGLTPRSRLIRRLQAEKAAELAGAGTPSTTRTLEFDDVANPAG